MGWNLPNAIHFDTEFAVIKETWLQILLPLFQWQKSGLHQIEKERNTSKEVLSFERHFLHQNHKYGKT